MNEKVKSIEARRHYLNSEISVVGHPDRATRLATEVQDFAATANPIIADMKGDVESAFADDEGRYTGEVPVNPEPRFDARHLVRALWFATAAVMMVDAGCAALLGALSFNLAKLPAVLVGLFLSTTVYLVTAAAWRTILVTDARCPAKSLKILRTQLKFLCPAYLACLVSTLLLGRLVSLATHNGTSILLFLLTVLSVLGPMLSANLVSLADLLSWARRHTILYRRLTKLELAIAELLRAANRLGVPNVHKQRVALTAVTTAAMILLFCGANAQASECGSLWFDSSGSVLASERLQAGAAAIAQLPAWAASSGCKVWAVYAFAGASFSDISFDIFTLPDSPAAVCPKRTAPAELDSIFRGPAEEAEKDRLQKCAASEAEERRKFQAAVDAQISQALGRLKSVKAVAPLKTCIVDTLQRLSEDKTRLALVATDGDESCLLNFRGTVAPPALRKQVIMVLVGQKNLPEGVSPGGYFARERKLWQARAPWLSGILPASGIDENTFDPIAAPVVQSASARDPRFTKR